MYFVKINRREYQVRFRHSNAVFRYTLCEIMRGDKVVAFGAAECHPKDNFCKNTGRKIALVRALQILFPTKRGKKRSRAIIARRKVFWDAYAEKRGGLD